MRRGALLLMPVLAFVAACPAHDTDPGSGNQSRSDQTSAPEPANRPGPEPRPHARGAMPAGWQLTEADPARPGYYLVAGHGPDAEHALVSARSLASATRESHVRDASVTATTTRLDESTGQLVETLNEGTLTVVGVDATLRGAEPAGAPVTVGATTWMRIRVPERWLFPVRTLQRVLAERPADAAARDHWLTELQALGEALLADGSVALAVAALVTRAEELGDPAEFVSLVRRLLAHDELRAAWHTWKLASQAAGPDPALDALQRELAEREATAWRNELNRLETLAHQHRRDDFRLIGPDHSALRAPLSLELRCPGEAYVSLLWLDPDGLFHWRHAGEDRTVGTRTLLHADSGGTARGRVTIYALGSRGPWHALLGFIPPDGITGSGPQRVDAIHGLRRLLDLLARDLPGGRFWIASCTFEVQ